MEATAHKEVWRRTATTLVADLTLLTRYRLTFERFDEIVRRSAPLAESFFVRYVRMWYGDALMSIVRRQSDAHERYNSLRTLLDDMLERTEAYSRKSLNVLFTEFGDRSPVEGYFRDFISKETYAAFADSSAETLDTDKISRDIETLDDISWELRHIIERALEDRERHGLDVDDSTTLTALGCVVDSFEGLAKRYVALLVGAPYEYYRPADDLQWTEIFTVPWISRNDA